MESLNICNRCCISHVYDGTKSYDGGRYSKIDLYIEVLHVVRITMDILNTNFTRETCYHDELPTVRNPILQGPRKLPAVTFSIMVSS